MPLYLEWAPEGSLYNENSRKIADESTSDKQTVDSGMEVEENESINESTNDKNTVVENNATDKITKENAEKVPEGNPEPETTIFVKNLNFQTRNDALRTVIQQLLLIFFLGSYYC